jgi:cobalt-precorrin 5A hydrolase
MKISMISFTKEGAVTCKKIETGSTAKGHECETFGKAGFAEDAGILPWNGSLSGWTEAAFREKDALIFVGAAGIAVRAIAPFLKDKTVDPAVIVVDEKGKFSISLLSGHIGGANGLAKEVADLIGAIPVITTATDINSLFAVDEWASRNHLYIENMVLAKEISVAILGGEVIGVSADYPIGGKLPRLLKYVTKQESGRAGGPADHEYPGIGFRVSLYEGEGPFAKTLRLIPKTVTVGVGCRKGVPLEAVEALLHQVLKEHGLSVHSIERFCSIDIKKEEAALRQLAEKLSVPLVFFSSAELEQLPGAFTASGFVTQITGVDNVCERTAVLGSQGELTVKKQAQNGVTIAIAVRKEEYRWNQESDRED